MDCHASLATCSQNKQSAVSLENKQSAVSLENKHKANIFAVWDCIGLVISSSWILVELGIFMVFEGFWGRFYAIKLYAIRQCFVRIVSSHFNQKWSNHIDKLSQKALPMI